MGNHSVFLNYQNGELELWVSGCMQVWDGGCYWLFLFMLLNGALSLFQMCGPTGAGFLYGKSDILQGLPPFLGKRSTP